MALLTEHVRLKRRWIYTRLHGVTYQERFIKEEIDLKVTRHKNVGIQLIPVEVFVTLGLYCVKLNTWVLSWGKKLMEIPNLFTCHVQYIVFGTWASWRTKRSTLWRLMTSGVPRNFVFSGGVQQIQLRTRDRENGDLGDVSPLVRGSGGSCNLVQEISFHIPKFS